MKKIIKAGTNPYPNEIELSNRALSRRAACESMVLLKNDGILPLKSEQVALFGSGARMTVKGGTGSGAVRERYSVNIETGLINAGFSITSASWLDRFNKFYNDTYESYRAAMEEKVKGVMEFYKILGMVTPFEHPTGIPVTEEDLLAAHSNSCDTAIYVLARQAGEGNDREDKKGDYRLDEVEFENLRTVSESFKNLIVVINAGGVIDVSFLEKIHVSALVYYVQGGEEGGNALAELISGKQNFSGKLATGWAYSFEDIPSNTTYSYLGSDRYNQEYNEGIYVGYRYFDTFKVSPRYHFGFGLSYTDFIINCDKAEISDENLVVAVNVTNVGKISGKEVVQLYATVPFGKAGAEYQRLIAFKKTCELAPGEGTNISMKVNIRNLTCYDEELEGYVLRKGSYIIRLGNSSDNTTKVLVLKNAEDQVVEKCFNTCKTQYQVTEIIAPERENEDISYVKAIEIPQTLECIKHDYSELPLNIDPYVDTMTDEQLIHLVVGGGTSNHNLQVEAMGASGTTSPDNYESLGIPNIILSDGPAGLNLTSHLVELDDGTLKAACVPEVFEAYKRYMFGIAGIGLKRQLAQPEEGTMHYQYATAWPCSQLLAQSFDEELMYEIGDAVGKEMEEYGVTIWLAPGMNIHRNPLCGRTFEYYSEDPLVSGKMAAAIVRGVQSHPGKGMSVKHFAANNCELERNSSSSNMSERALREIYLKGFEIAVKESEPTTVMAAYNKINGTYCTNNYDLLVKILRMEWGFKGMVMSDWDSMKAKSNNPSVAETGDVLKAMHAQCDLVCPGRKDQEEALMKGLSEGIVNRDDIKRCASRVLRLIRQNTVLESK